ncbi:MAG TPA: hypothetical protein VNS88_14065 [Nitrospiraceae bacterium]|nr:hypothetical protein [Nitrospiraceae bacterium]
MLTIDPNDPDWVKALKNRRNRIEEQNKGRQFFMTIVPTNTSGIGDPACELVVIEHICVIKEPIEAKHANDVEVLDVARVAVAARLGVDIENVEY